MMLIGPDFRAGLNHALYRPFSPAGLLPAIGTFIGLLIVNQLVLVPLFGFAVIALTSGQTSSESDWTRAILVAILPASLVTAGFAWLLARRRGVDPRDVLALRFPALGLFGWLLVVVGFFASITALFVLLAVIFGHDLNSSGLVEQGTVQFRLDPLFFLIAAGLIIGAPLAEEFIFRGQIFAALAETPLGFRGASLITSALWAVTHGMTQPPFIIGLLFLMGLLLSWLLVRFGSLWVTIACHAAWNAMSVWELATKVTQ